MTPTEIRQLLVDAIRMLERAEIIDHSGHCSARRDQTSFYINSGASVRSALRTEDVVVADLDGALLEGVDRPPLEFHLHSEIYRARPDVNVVMHTHPRWSTMLTMVGAAFRPVYAQATVLGDVPMMDSPLSINTKAMGERVATLLGEGHALLLKSHGAIVAGGDVVECFALATYLEENARRQFIALQVGEPYVFSEAEQQACRATQMSASLLKKTWDYYRAKLA